VLGRVGSPPPGPRKRQRTDHADFAYNGSKNLHVRDLSTDLDVPHEFINAGGVTYLRVLASDVPSAGYKAFEIQSGPESAPTNAAGIVGRDNAMLENSRVKLTLDADGAIASFLDKARSNAELAQTIDGLKLNDFAANATNGNAIVVEDCGPVSVTLKCVSDTGRQHTTRVSLFRDSEHVEIRNDITENLADVRHRTFGFNLSSPDFHAEKVGAVIRAKTKCNGGSHAETHARYDYMTLNHFANIAESTNSSTRAGPENLRSPCAVCRALRPSVLAG
jgi:alpha-mannosidase